MRWVVAVIVASAACAGATTRLENRTFDTPVCDNQSLVIYTENVFVNSIASIAASAKVPSLPQIPRAGMQLPLNMRDIQVALVRQYPPDLRDAGVGSKGTMLVVIDTVGVVVAKQMVTSTGFASFDRVALSVIGQAKFNPAVLEGCRVHGVIGFPVEFKSDGLRSGW